MSSAVSGSINRAVKYCAITGSGSGCTACPRCRRFRPRSRRPRHRRATICPITPLSNSNRGSGHRPRPHHLAVARAARSSARQGPPGRPLPARPGPAETPARSVVGKIEQRTAAVGVVEIRVGVVALDPVGGTAATRRLDQPSSGAAQGLPPLAEEGIGRVPTSRPFCAASDRMCRPSSRSVTQGFSE